MAIYNLDNIIDTIVEASNPSAPAGLQMLDAFKALNHNVKKQKLSRFIQGLKSVIVFLKTRAQEGMNQFFDKYHKSGGKVSAETYTAPGPIKDAMHALCDNTDGLKAFLQQYGQFFNLQTIDVDVNSLQDLLRKATDPEGKRDKSAYEKAFSDTAAYKAATNEAFENDPVIGMLLPIKAAYQKLRQDLIYTTQAANSVLERLDADVIEQGKKLVNAASQGVEMGGRAAQRTVKDIGDVVKPFDPRLGNSPADAIRTKQIEQANDYFKDAPIEPQQKSTKYKPMSRAQHEAYLAAQAARGNYTESIVDVVANMLTEDPDIIIS